MKKKYLALALAGVSLLTACASKDEEITPPALEAELEEDQEEVAWFKDMKTKNLKGEEIDSSIFAENDLTLVNAWNTGCPPCLAELPELEKVSKRYDNVGIKGLVIELSTRGISPGISDKERASVDKILEGAQAKYEQILVWEDLLDTAFVYYLEAFPTTFFLDSQGEIVYIMAGAKDEDGWVETIDKVLELVKDEE